jgi:hypothetical protein
VAFQPIRGKSAQYEPDPAGSRLVKLTLWNVKSLALVELLVFETA